MNMHWIIPIGLLLAGPVFAQTPANYHLVKKTVVGGEGGWDYLLADADGGRLYVSHGTQVDVLDLKSHAKIGVITPTPGVHGIAVVPGTSVGYTTNGRPNTATMFDTKTLKATKEIPTGTKPDAIMYDAFSKRVFIFNNEGNSATVLDAVTGNVAGTVDLGGAPEAAVTDDNGTIFVNLEDKNQVAVFDAKSLSVKHHWSLGTGEEPTGLAFDKVHHRLFSTCHNKEMVVLDSQTGKVLATVPIGSGVDGAVFDTSTGSAISSNGEGSLTVVKETKPGTFEAVQTVQTQRGARTITIDPVSHHIFVTTADYGPAPAATTENPRPRPSVVPGSFTVMEYSK
ncbi:YncE family protein [Spirosoma spitsbergense]|uniref:YncE family protein n=1 Tax=Spirosoma spitsbergense TaxID=431554 RepID=UPI00036A4ED9|nr:PQQ-binding-like beta-propeller repeat protein [Spirosoma spitsbergense]